MIERDNPELGRPFSVEPAEWLFGLATRLTEGQPPDAAHGELVKWCRRLVTNLGVVCLERGESVHDEDSYMSIELLTSSSNDDTHVGGVISPPHFRSRALGEAYDPLHLLPVKDPLRHIVARSGQGVIDEILDGGRDIIAIDAMEANADIDHIRQLIADYPLSCWQPT
jgi:hypothetical protein